MFLALSSDEYGAYRLVRYDILQMIMDNCSEIDAQDYRREDGSWLSGMLPIDNQWQVFPYEVNARNDRYAIMIKSSVRYRCSSAAYTEQFLNVSIGSIPSISHERLHGGNSCAVAESSKQLCR